MEHDSQTSTTLLKLAQAGDDAAWQQLQKLYTPLIFFWCRRLDVDPQDTREIWANVLGSASLQLKRFQHNGRKGAFRKWLRIVTQHEVSDYYRARRSVADGVGGTTAQNLLEQASALDDSQASEEVTILYHQAWDLIRSEFSARDNEIFSRVVEGEEAAKDVAHDLDLPAYIVHKVVSRIKHRVRGMLDDEVDA